jgi:hypothetical protein
MAYKLYLRHPVSTELAFVKSFPSESRAIAFYQRNYLGFSGKIVKSGGN